jgi:methyl-accepting chemotaxis protein
MRKWSIIPRRTEYAQRLTTMRAAFASAWARIYRQVFWLSDGHRTVEHISVLLHKPSDTIEEITYELLVSGHVKVQAGEKELAMDPVVLKESFNMVAPYKEAFARHFYFQLFTNYPQTRQLFPPTEEGMRRQESSLIATLAVVVAGVERGENLTQVVRKLGERHRRYGAQAAHYPLVGQLLLQTFQDFLGDAFTPQMREAWSKAYEIISTEMLKGANQSRDEEMVSVSDRREMPNGPGPA